MKFLEASRLLILPLVFFHFASSTTSTEEEEDDKFLIKRGSSDGDHQLIRPFQKEVVDLRQLETSERYKFFLTICGQSYIILRL